jgi:acyl-CoA synthetase (AMP-forming)/AMP-acid ligase II
MTDPRKPSSGSSHGELPSPDVTFAEVLSRALAASAPRESTLTDGQLTLPYAALPDRLTAIDELLAARGIAPGAVLALEATTSIAGVLALLAVFHRRSSLVLLPPDRSATKPPLPRFCRHVVTVRSQLTDGATIDLARPASFLEITEHATYAAPSDPDALSTGRLFLRTSGSIGTPKLVMFTHGRLLANGLNVIDRLHLRADDRIAIPVPITHMFGLGAALLPALAAGASIDLVEGANLLRFFEHERRFRPTVAYLTPALCFMLARQRSVQEHYRHIVVAGDVLKPETFEAAERRFRRVVNLYGCTELGGISAADAEAELPVDPTELARRTTTVGTAFPGVELRLEAPGELPELPDLPPAPVAASSPPTSARRAPASDVGSITCHHPFGFDGYLTAEGEPATSESILPGGWYRPRDLARLHPGGLLEVIGRADHSVNRSGRLVVLAEVERAIESLPGIDRAVTVLGGESLRGREIVAFCVLRDGDVLDDNALRAACATVLPSYAIPDHVRITPSVPLLRNGKVDRRALEAAVLAEPAIAAVRTQDKEPA